MYIAQIRVSIQFSRDISTFSSVTFLRIPFPVLTRSRTAEIALRCISNAACAATSHESSFLRMIHQTSASSQAGRNITFESLAPSKSREVFNIHFLFLGRGGGGSAQCLLSVCSLVKPPRVILFIAPSLRDTPPLSDLTRRGCA